MPISSTSFLRGLDFPVQKHLGDSLHRSLSLPRGHRVQPSASCWGSSGATPGRGCVRFPHVQANYELSYGGCRRKAERVRCAAHLHARMHITSAHTHACTIIITDYECACSFGAQVACDKCHFCVRHFGGVFLSPYKPAQLCTRSAHHVLLTSVMWTAIMLVCGMCLGSSLCVEWVMNVAIS